MAGYQVRSTDGVIGTSGSPVVVLGFSFEPTATTDSVKFYEGTSTAGTLAFTVTPSAYYTGSANAVVPTLVSFSEGVTFPGGLYLDVTGTLSVTVFYRKG